MYGAGAVSQFVLPELVTQPAISVDFGDQYEPVARITTAQYQDHCTSRGHFEQFVAVSAGRRGQFAQFVAVRLPEFTAMEPGIR
ncbi:hypothetical protein D3C80_1153950 [compost metagenome]